MAKSFNIAQATAYLRCAEPWHLDGLFFAVEDKMAELKVEANPRSVRRVPTIKIREKPTGSVRQILDFVQSIAPPKDDPSPVIRRGEVQEAFDYRVEMATKRKAAADAKFTKDKAELQLLHAVLVQCFAVLQYVPERPKPDDN